MPVNNLLSVSNLLHIVFATADCHSALKMITGIKSKLPNWRLTFGAVVFGQKQVELQLADETTIITHSELVLPIHQSRNICQQYLKSLMASEGGLGLVLDDDLDWIMPEPEFTDLCERLVEQNIDMAFIQLAGDGPIPKEYTRAAPLLDVLLAMNSSQYFDLNFRAQAWLSDINVVSGDTNVKRLHDHHDFYAYTPSKYTAAKLSLDDFNFTEFIRALALGKTTTRAVAKVKGIEAATGRERGGATLIFNERMLAFKNLAMKVGDYYSRRSDMLMAKQAARQGAQLRCVPAVLAHNRQSSFDSHKVNKLLGDMIGYALTESFDCSGASVDLFFDLLVQRTERTRLIVADSSMMLTWLLEVLVEQPLESQPLESSLRVSQYCLAENEQLLITQMIAENNDTLKALAEFEINMPQLMISTSVSDCLS